jgi:tetratricopeptide (TPR) repeat protein
MKMRKFTGRFLAAGLALMLCGGLAMAQVDLNQKVQSGWQALQQGNLKQARDDFQAVIDASPVYDFGWYAMGQVATREGKYDEAITNFKRALELNPNKFEYHYGLAAAYRSKEDFAKAIATMNNAETVATEPQSLYYLHLERGLSYLSIRQYDRAADDLDKAVKAQPKDKTAQQRLGMSLYGLQEYARSLEHLRKAAALDSKDYTTQLYLAKAAINLAQREQDARKKEELYGEAVRSARAASGIKSGFDAQNVLARAYLGAKNFNEAARAFQKVVASKPDYCPGQVNLGQSYIGLQAWPQAASELQKASDCDPQNTVTLNLLGFAYQKSDMRDEALAAFERSYAIKPDPKVKEDIERVRQNIQIAQENLTVEAFNQQQLDDQQREKEEFERLKAEYEAEQKRIEEYKEKNE